VEPLPNARERIKRHGTRSATEVVRSEDLHVCARAEGYRTCPLIGQVACHAQASFCGVRHACRAHALKSISKLFYGNDSPMESGEMLGGGSWSRLSRRIGTGLERLRSQDSALAVGGTTPATYKKLAGKGQHEARHRAQWACGRRGWQRDVHTRARIPWQRCAPGLAGRLLESAHSRGRACTRRTRRRAAATRLCSCAGSTLPTGGTRGCSSCDSTAADRRLRTRPPPALPLPPRAMARCFRVFCHAVLCSRYKAQH